ncbi:MAG: glycosyltransferase [Anaerolineales bacterium]|nr:glycosyltransferase [Anaerolineales bacterium]
MNILQVATYDVAGGAEAVAMQLHRGYRARGHTARLAVGTQRGVDPGVFQIRNGVGPWGWPRFWWTVADWARSAHFRGRGRVVSLAQSLADPGRQTARRRGQEVLAFRGSWHLLTSAPEHPAILHAHNLHGGYFDLAALPALSRQAPLFLTLHDAWLLSGHCAHSFGCQRWQSGCGQCPDLSIPPAIPRDHTANNWRAKRDWYAHSRLYVATPCSWLMHRVEQSMLAPGIVEARVIPNGLDLCRFRPGDRAAARSRLGLPADALILLFTANHIQLNRWKDYATLRQALEQVAAAELDRPVHLLALGDAGPAEKLGRATLTFVPFQADPAVVAAYYQAADVYVHSAHADTFPNSVLEALACGTPVVATRVGGIPEQVSEGVDGYLIAPANAAELAAGVLRLLGDADQRAGFGRAAAAKAHRLYDGAQQADAYLTWYQEALARTAAGGAPSHA